MSQRAKLLCAVSEANPTPTLLVNANDAVGIEINQSFKTSVRLPHQDIIGRTASR